jgi:hypothetical protein
VSAVRATSRWPRFARSAAEDGRWTWGALALLVSLATVLFYIEGRGASFVRDDWHLILARRGHSAEVLLSPHNGHLLVLQALIYKALLKTVGLASYVPYQALALGLHALVNVLLFVLARRRVGPVAALAVVAVLLIPGGLSANDVLWPFQIGFLISVAAVLGMILALERGDRRGDLAACGLLAIALASSSIGLAAAGAAVVDVGLRSDRARRLARVVALPVGLWVLWYVTYGRQTPASLLPATGYLQPALPENLYDAPRFVFNAAGVALAATIGLDGQFGPPLVLAAVALIGMRVRREGWLAPGLWAALALAVAYWGLLALGRAQTRGFAEPRYLYPGIAFVLVAGVECARGVRLSWRGVGVLGVAASLIVLSNIGVLVHYAPQFRGLGQEVLPRLTGLELARGRVDPSFRPMPAPASPAPDIVASSYFDAIDDFGSPAPTPAELARQPEPQRILADATLLQALGAGPRPGAPARSGASPPPVVRANGGRVNTEGGCVVLDPAGPGAAVEVRVPSAGIALTTRPRGPLELSARRLADTFGAPFATVAGGQRAVLSFPPDRLARPWYVRMSAAKPVRACGLAR